MKTKFEIELLRLYGSILAGILLGSNIKHGEQNTVIMSEIMGRNFLKLGIFKLKFGSGTKFNYSYFITGSGNFDYEAVANSMRAIFQDMIHLSGQVKGEESLEKIVKTIYSLLIKNRMALYTSVEVGCEGSRMLAISQQEKCGALKYLMTHTEKDIDELKRLMPIQILYILHSIDRLVVFSGDEEMMEMFKDFTEKLDYKKKYCKLHRSPAEKYLMIYLPRELAEVIVLYCPLDVMDEVDEVIIADRIINS